MAENVDMEVSETRFHVIPIEDLEEHGRCADCSCKPEIRPVENRCTLIIHNAFDGRDLVEKYGLQ